MNPGAPLDCLYLSIQIESVFLYGGTAGIRTQNWQIKSLL